MISFVWLLCVAMLIVVPSYAQNTKSADKYVKLGVWRLVRSDYDNAIADFDKALASKPDFGLAYFYRGKARQAKGDLDGAIDDYECAFRTDARIVKVAADVAEVYRARGLLRLEELNLDQAISDFDKAISLKPDQAENYFQRGTARLIDGDLNAAISDFDRCIQLHSKYAKAYLSRGVAHMHQGNKREARQDFDKCRELKHESDFMLQMYILGIETKIKERRTRRSSQGDRIASGSANNRDLS